MGTKMYVYVLHVYTNVYRYTQIYRVDIYKCKCMYICVCIFRLYYIRLESD